VRMSKEQYGRECKICTRPFTIFRWRPGSDARYKKTEVCQTCSKAKNVCQVCLLDLEYGLPVQVRDKAMGQESTQLAKSDVNREYQAELMDKAEAQGIDFNGPGRNYGKAQKPELLLKLQRTTPYYKRNRAHLCSFFAKGECTRGAECPYRHEMPDTGPLAEQNLKDRYYGVNDPVAAKLMSKADDMTLLAPPEDQSIMTLFIGGLDPKIGESDLRDTFYGYGEISSVRVISSRSCAFVTYTTREAAEKAAAALCNKLVVKGVRCKLLWGKPAQPKPEASSSVADAAPSTSLGQAQASRMTAPMQAPSLGAPAGGPAFFPPQVQAQMRMMPPPMMMQPPTNFFNLPPNAGFAPPPRGYGPPQGMAPPPNRTYYPSMNPNMMGTMQHQQRQHGPPSQQ